MADDARPLEEEARKGSKARQFLDDPVFAESVRDVEEALLNGIKRSAFKDSDLREKLCQQYMLLHSVLDQLRTRIDTGKMAEEEIRQLTVREKLKKAANYMRGIV